MEDVWSLYNQMVADKEEPHVQLELDKGVFLGHYRFLIIYSIISVNNLRNTCTLYLHTSPLGSIIGDNILFEKAKCSSLKLKHANQLPQHSI